MNHSPRRNVNGKSPCILFAAMVSMVLSMTALGYAEQTASESSEEETSNVYQLREVVVTESKMPQSQEHVTQKIDVIQRDTIDRTVMQHNNVSELFAYQPGTFVNPLSRNDANWGSYGGLGPKYNTFLLDGLPIDSFVDTMSLDTMAFERAEVQRGPASVLYSNYLTMDFAGNETPLAGITNLVLKDKIDAPLTRIAARGGSYDTVGALAFHQGATGGFNYFLGGDFEKSNYTNYGTKDSWLHMLDRPEYQKTKLYGKVAYFFGSDDHKLTLFAHHTQHTGDAGRPNRDYDHNYSIVQSSYTYPFTDKLHGQLKAGYRNYDREWGEDGYPANLNLTSRNGVKQHIIPMDLTFLLNHWGKSMLTVGIDSQVATYETYSIANGIETKGNDALAYNIGPYLQEKVVMDRLTLRAGLRHNTTRDEYDLISGAIPEVSHQTWNKLLWSAGVRYAAIDRVSVYANGGSSFLVPSAKSVGGTLKASDQGVAGKHGQLPNPDLKPETGVGMDTGVECEIADGLIADARFFLTKVDDAIVEVRVSDDPSQSKSINAGNTTSYGAEAEVRHDLNTYLQWFANYTYTHSNVGNDVDPDVDGTDVPFVPDHMGNVGISVSLPFGLTVSPYVHVVGTYYDSTSRTGRKSFGPYEVLSAHIRQVVYEGAGASIRLNLNLYNLTDKRYEMPWQFQDTGFALYGGVEGIF